MHVTKRLARVWELITIKINLFSFLLVVIFSVFRSRHRSTHANKDYLLVFFCFCFFRRVMREGGRETNRGEKRTDSSNRFVSNNVSRRGRSVRCSEPIWWHRDRNSSVWVRRLSSSELWSPKEQMAPNFNQNNDISYNVNWNTKG